MAAVQAVTSSGKPYQASFSPLQLSGSRTTSARKPRSKLLLASSSFAKADRSWTPGQSQASPASLSTAFRVGTAHMSSHLSFSLAPLRFTLATHEASRPLQKRGVLKSTRAVGPIDLFIGLAVSMAGVAALAIPFMVFTTVMAGAATAFAFVFLSVFALPVIPLAMGAFGLLGFTIPFVWTILDKLLFLAVAMNFIIGVIGLQAAKSNPQMFDVPEGYRKNIPKNVRKWLTEEGVGLSDLPLKARRKGKKQQASKIDPSKYDLQKGFWILPSLLSFVPGLHGAGWIAAFNDWPAFASARWDMRAGLIRNALVYGGTGLLGLLLANPFAPTTAATVTKMATKCWGIFCTTAPVTITKTAAASTGSFWLSLVLGAAHLQLDRAWLKQVAEAKSSAGGSKGSSVVVDVAATVSDAELSKKDLEEFDARLRYRTSGGLLGERAVKWSTTEVGLWLQDNGFSEFADSFESHDITGSVLLALNDDELRNELGMERLGQRKRLLLLVEELKRQQS